MYKLRRAQAIDDANAALLESFAAYQRRRNFSKKTITCRTSVLECFAVHLDGQNLLAANRPNFEAWLDTRRLGAQSRYSYTATAHAFYR